MTSDLHQTIGKLLYGREWEKHLAAIEDMALLERVGVLMYGQRWQQEMALALDVDARTIRRWHVDAEKIPDRAWRKLKNVGRDRRSDAGTAVVLLREHQGAMPSRVPNGIAAIEDKGVEEVAPLEPALPPETEPGVEATEPGSWLDTLLAGPRPDPLPVAEKPVRPRRLRPQQREKLLLAIGVDGVQFDDTCLIAPAPDGKDPRKVLICRWTGNGLYMRLYNRAHKSFSGGSASRSIRVSSFASSNG